MISIYLRLQQGAEPFLDESNAGIVPTQNFSQRGDYSRQFGINPASEADIRNGKISGRVEIHLE